MQPPEQEPKIKNSRGFSIFVLPTLVKFFLFNLLASNFKRPPLSHLWAQNNCEVGSGFRSLAHSWEKTIAVEYKFHPLTNLIQSAQNSQLRLLIYSITTNRRAHVVQTVMYLVTICYRNVVKRILILVLNGPNDTIIFYVL